LRVGWWWKNRVKSVDVPQKRERGGEIIIIIKENKKTRGVKEVFPLLSSLHTTVGERRRRIVSRPTRHCVVVAKVRSPPVNRRAGNLQKLLFQSLII
jgi:hypothetical protein